MNQLQSIKPRTWVAKKHGTAEQLALVFVIAVGEQHVTYIKPNCWCGRNPRDARAGWTKPARCPRIEIYGPLNAADLEGVRRYTREIGKPGGVA